MSWLGDTFNSAKKKVKDVASSPGRAAMAIGTMGLSESGIGEKIDKKFISGDYDAKNKAANLKKEAQKKQDAAFNQTMKSQTGLDQGLTGQMQSSADKYKGERNDIMGQMAGVDKTYGNSIADTEKKFSMDQQALKDQAADQSKDATKVYQELSPRYKDNMEQAQKNSQSAMSLADYMNPNNQVAQQTRALYDTQAQNEGKAGLQSAGILSNVMAQSAGSQMGGPMSVGQQVAMQAAAQRQAGEAYSNTQRRMQGLQDQGLERGFEQSDKAYNAGLGAQDKYRQSMGDYEGVMDRNVSRQSNLRGEQSGYGENIRGSGTRQADTARGVEGGILNRKMGASQEDYGLDTGLARDVYGRDTARTAAGQQRSDYKADRTYQDVQDKLRGIDAEAARNRGIAGGVISGGTSIASMAMGAPPMGGGGMAGATPPGPQQGSFQPTPIYQGGGGIQQGMGGPQGVPTPGNGLPMQGIGGQMTAGSDQYDPRLNYRTGRTA